MLNFVFNLFNSSSDCFSPYKLYFLYDSYFTKGVNELFQNTYGIVNIFDNDKDALISRIKFVQSRERLRSIRSNF